MRGTHHASRRAWIIKAAPCGLRPLRQGRRFASAAGSLRRDGAGGPEGIPAARFPSAASLFRGAAPRPAALSSEKPPAEAPPLGPLEQQSTQPMGASEDLGGRGDGSKRDITASVIHKALKRLNSGIPMLHQWRSRHRQFRGKKASWEFVRSCRKWSTKGLTF